MIMAALHIPRQIIPDAVSAFAADQAWVGMAGNSVAALAAKKATGTIPIVIVAADPVGLGLVASLARGAAVDTDRGPTAVFGSLRECRHGSAHQQKCRRSNYAKRARNQERRSVGSERIAADARTDRHKSNP